MLGGGRDIARREILATDQTRPEQKEDDRADQLKVGEDTIGYD